MYREKPKHIASVEVGPMSDCREQLWSKLANFSAWTDYLPGLDSLQLTNADPVGRGTVLLQQWGNKEETWQISHWHPGQRLELIQQETAFNLGLRFGLNAGQAAETIQLLLEAEISVNSGFAIADPLYVLFLSRRLKTRFMPLLSAVQAG